MKTVVSPAFQKNNFEDKPLLQQLDKIFLTKRKQVFRIPKKGESVILLLSGGLDSTNLWNILMGKYGLHVYPVHFLDPNYFFKGEEESICYYSKVFKELYPDLFHPVEIMRTSSHRLLKTLQSAAVISDIGLVIRNLVYNRESDNYKVSISYETNPFYNYFFNAYAYAQRLRASQAKDLNTIIVGLLPEDTALHRNSTLTVLRSINLSLCTILGDFSWQLTGAIEEDKKFYLPRKVLIKYAINKKINLGHTWSCMENFKIQCGKCGPCVIRRDAFKQMGIKDLTVYQNSLLDRLHHQLSLKKRLFNLLSSLDDRNKNKKINITKSNVGKYYFTPALTIDWTIVSNQVHLFDKKYGEINILNDSGSLLWQHIIKGKNTFHQLLLILKKRYRNQQRLPNDLILFLNNCVNNQSLVLKEKGENNKL